jgi:carbonic anhydrase
MLTRRRFFRRSTGAAITTFGSGAMLEFALVRCIGAQNLSNPEAALQDLISGNQRFTSNRLTHHEHDLDILKQHTIDRQEPFAAVLSCADSRVPVELVFDQSIGHIFVTRIAGNIATAEIIGSLEYAVAVLGTKLIVVMGHSGCGAVKATMESQEAPGQISALYPHIQLAVDKSGSDLETAIRTNARIQASLLRKSSTVISHMVKKQNLRVIAAYYDLASGKVMCLE